MPKRPCQGAPAERGNWSGVIIGDDLHVSEAHLQRYLHEFDFRYNNRVALGVDDAERATRAIQGAAGKRLMYRQPRRTHNPKLTREEFRAILATIKRESR